MLKKVQRKTSNKKSSNRQFYGKSSEIMIPVPLNVKKTALYAYEIRDMGFGGGQETGWRRAYQLAHEKSIPIEDLKFMHAWFARHIYTSYPSYKEWILAGQPNNSQWHKKHGIVAWLIWGGDAAYNWVYSKSNTKLLNMYYKKNYISNKL